MKFLDLFAGIGGFHLGMEQAGHQCVGWVEWDKFARQSYQAIHNVKGVWNASDIRTVRASELPRADCWCFGFPCQDISVAGKQKGFTAGKRSSLFFTVTGLIRNLEEEDRPSYLLIENVKNLLSINRGFDFLKLQIELDEIGYDVEWSVLDSAEVIPQHRERIFIVGHLRGRRTRKVFPIISKGQQPDNDVKQVGNLTPDGSFGGNPQVGRVYGIDGIAPTLSTMQGGGQEPKVMVREATKKGFEIAKIGDTINFSQPNSKTRRGRVGHGIANTMTTTNTMATLTSDLRIRKLTPLECWRLQGFPDWAFERAKQVGLSDSQLYKQAGNSVTVPIIKAIAGKMKLEDKL
ncbi:DNA cytosine methyltransferase [Lactiplantibacillus plantarum]|nr:DNA cytosine methyltransferase [Lactiplantibacillus plantarum]MCG0864853.1 DNA cytosine methyltransferase [Lactiplantibacillus plantarum]